MPCPGEGAGPLAGLRVVDASWGMPGSVATCLLADFGADVVKLERPGGPAPEADTHRPTLDRGKRSIEVDLWSPDGLELAHDLIAGADVLVEAFGARNPLPSAETLERNAALVHCRIVGYGPGPWADRPAYEALVAARMGFMAEQPGHRKGPIFLGHPSISYTTGFLAVIATLAALRAREVTGAGQQATVSMLDGVLAQAPMNWWYSENEASYRDTEEKGHFGHRRLLLDMYRCADGEHIMVHSGGQGGFKAMMEVLGVGEHFRTITDAPEMSVPLDDDELVVARQVVPTLWASRPRDEWLRLLRARDVACVPVLRPGEVLRHEQVRHLGLATTVPDPDRGELLQVAPCIRFSDTPAPALRPAPRVGEHNAGIPELRERARQRVRTVPEAAPLRHALEGLTVLDFSTFFAAAYGAKLLGDLGADVIKVEPVEGDPMRPLPDPFEACQRGKRTIAVDLRTAEGRQVAHELVRKADVVVHNLRPGKAEKIGLGYEELRRIRPQLIYCYQPGWGASGPDAHRKSFAPLMSALTGLMFAAAGADNPPVRRARASEDYYGGFLGAAAVLMALQVRARTGRGQYVEAAQLAASLFATMEHSLDAAGGRVPGPVLDSDQHGFGPLHRLFPTADGMVCVAVVGARARLRLAALLEAGAGAEDMELSELLAARLAGLPGEEAVALLDSHRIPCEVARDIPFMPDFFWQDWVVDEGKVFEHEGHPIWGYIREVGQVMSLSDTPGVQRGPGPLLGHHTLEILGELGRTEHEIDELIATGVVAAAAEETG